MDVAAPNRENVILVGCELKRPVSPAAGRGAEPEIARRSAGACTVGWVATMRSHMAGTARRIEALRRFGQELGLCFQAIDDLLGIWGEPAVTGKPAGNDLREGKKSIPVAVALSSGTRAGDMLADLYAQEHLNESDIARAAVLVEEAGGRAATAEAARDCMRRAAQALTAADLEERPAEELLDLASFVVNREF